MRRASALTVAVLAATLVGSPAAAQGKSSKAPTPSRGHGHQPGAGSGPAAPTAITPSPATASFNSWIDDATVLTTGAVWFSVSAGEWNSDAGRDIQAPVTAVVAGLAPHVSIGGNLPVDSFRDSTGVTTTDLGDVSLFGKIGLVDPSAHRLGVAVVPVVELMSAAAGSGRSADWALPVSLEVRGSHGRVYGTAGYFSGGSIFGTTAVELRLAPKITITGRFGHTYAVDATTVPVGESRHRTDLSAVLMLTASPRAAVFAAIGHAYSGDATADGGPWFAGGIAFRTR